MPVWVIDTLKPKNGLDFPVVEAIDVAVEGYSSLADAVTHFATDTAIAALTAALDSKANSTEVNASLVSLQTQINQIEIAASAEAVVAPEVISSRVGNANMTFATLKERLDEESKEHRQAELNILENIFSKAYGKSVPAGTFYEGKSVKPVGSTLVMETNANLDTLYFVAHEDFDVYYKENPTEQYYALCIATAPATYWYADGTKLNIDGVSAARYRNIDENLPSENSKLHVNVGDVICITITHGVAPYICGDVFITDTLKTGLNLSESQVQQIKKETKYSDTREKIDTIFQTGSTIISDIPGIIKRMGYSSAVSPTYHNSIRLDENSNYDTYYVIIDDDYDIYPVYEEGNYVSIAIGHNFTEEIDYDNFKILDSENAVRYRSMDSNLPDAEHPVHISAGDVVAFTADAGKVFSIVGLNYVVTNEFLEDLASGNNNPIIEAAVSEIITKSIGAEYTQNSVYDDTFDGYAMATRIVPSPNYKSFCLIITDDTDLFVEEPVNTTYFSVCVYDNQQLANGVRYRKYASEDTLPYEDSPIHVVAGQYVIFTVNQTSTAFVVSMPSYPAEDEIKDNIKLSQKQVDQVIREIGTTKHCQFRYIRGSGDDSSTERFEIFVPTGNGYIRYDFLHCVSDAKNADIWRMGYVYHVDEYLDEITEITTHGEWEMAVHLPDRPDFSGGITHGDEVMTDVVFFVDGGPVNLETLTDRLYNFTEIVIVQTANVYDPDEESQLSDSDESKILIAEHGSLHKFSAEGLEIDQTLDWKINSDITSCYMAMHLPAKSATNSAILDSNFLPFEIEEYGNTYDDVTKAIIYGDNVKTEFSVTEYPDGYTDSKKFLLTDNNGGLYNKCYFIVAREGSVTSTTLWKSKTKYRFDAN